VSTVVHRPGGSPPTGVTTDVSAVELELRTLFHRLNNQLGIILAHAELLEAKAADDNNRARAAQVVAATLDAMSTARDIRRRTEPIES
jgi:hypothetical protein